MPRKSDNEKPKRTARLPETRVTADELATVKAKAADAGLTLSEFQRQQLLNGVVVVRKNAVDNQAVSQLMAIGNNLNQLTRKAHIHNEYDRQRMNDILSTLETLTMGLME